MNVQSNVLSRYAIFGQAPRLLVINYSCNMVNYVHCKNALRSNQLCHQYRNNIDASNRRIDKFNYIQNSANPLQTNRT